MFFIVLRKLLNNKWMVACLLVGSIVAVAMISSIPMYTDGILQRMLIKDMEAYQQRTGSYPGRYLFKLNCFSYYKPDSRYGAFLYFRQNIRDSLTGELDTPIAAQVEKLTIDYIALIPEVQKVE
ncbi:MAG: ABC transporter permease, partial [Clostridiales bacterium]|nr:ABC transporter permease [Clostridiales bacterium]